jgi:hypothetical protein
MASEQELQPTTPPLPIAGPGLTLGACLAGVLLPGLGHAVLRKWDRAAVFLGSALLMFAFGLHLKARLFNPDLTEFFSALKFLADAGNGLLYWASWFSGLGLGEPTAYTYDFGNLFIFGAGLLNMLMVVDVFDIARGRKP